MEIYRAIDGINLKKEIHLFEDIFLLAQVENKSRFEACENEKINKLYKSSANMIDEQTFYLLLTAGYKKLKCSIFAVIFPAFLLFTHVRSNLDTFMINFELLVTFDEHIVKKHILAFGCFTVIIQAR